MDDREDLYRLMIVTTLDACKEWGIALPDALKIRDKREPERMAKIKLEEKIAASTMRHFRRQAGKVKQHLEAFYPDRKAVRAPDWLDEDELWDDEDWESELYILLYQGAKKGIDLFSQVVQIGMDYTLTNAEAAKWARKYAYSLVKNINDTTREALQKTITQFVETPGMTLGNIIEQIKPFYDDTRAMMIATTETTRAYAQGQLMAGDDLKKQFPDVKVTKKWYTNQDDRVCPYCGDLDGTEVEIDEVFYPPDDYSDGNPPRHINCRCWIDNGTRINE